jgi:uncharacterized coiled-coil protein SlyX
MERMTSEQLKDLIPYLIGTVSTIIALNKDYISSKLFKRQSILDINSSAEDLEGKQLSNVEHEIRIYRELLDDTKIRFETTIQELKNEIEELNKLVKEQKIFIQKQSRSLDYYEKKCTNRDCRLPSDLNK